MTIRDGHVEGVVFPPPQHRPNATTLSPIGPGIWTHIGVRVMSTNTDDNSVVVAADDDGEDNDNDTCIH